jgi:hypothetical protein
MEQERILCAAIHFDDGNKYIHQPKNIKTGFVVCGRRHHNCFAIIGILGKDRLKFNVVQGFITNTDRFVDRYEAFKVTKGGSGNHKLYSEDLY